MNKAPKTYHVIGIGHFGKKAIEALLAHPNSKVICADLDPKAVAWAKYRGAIAKELDGIRYMVEEFHLMEEDSYIVPALPLHLAAEWLILYTQDRFKIQKLPMPGDILEKLPNPCILKTNDVAISYANFKCPDDCVEPPYCTVTNIKREIPLNKFISSIKVNGTVNYVIKSTQLGPGMGGYKKKKLSELLKVIEHISDNMLLTTACSCHGIMTLLKIK